MRTINPIYLMHQAGMDPVEIGAVIDGIDEILTIAGVKQAVSLKNFGVWRNPGYVEGNRLKPHQSVDWYLQQGVLKSERDSQLNANTVVSHLVSEPWRMQQNHFDVVLTNIDMNGDNQGNFVIGSAIRDIGTIISTNRFSDLDDRSKYECIKTAAMHEVGHVFGLPRENRGHSLEYSLGPHCTNSCVMRQGLTVPHDWINFSKDRLRTGAICGSCFRDLRAYFGA